MKHIWESKNPAPGTKYFEYWGCHDVRECKNCGIIQAKHSKHEWMRVVGYYWYPKAGRCKGKKDDL